MTPKIIPSDIGNVSLQGTKLRWVVTGEIAATTCLLGVGRSLEEDWEAFQREENHLFGRSYKKNL